MSRRDSDLLWLKDLLEHLGDCQRQLDWAQDAETVNLVMDTMLRDLERCRGLCESLRQLGGVRRVS
jgi:hypothetical protein